MRKIYIQPSVETINFDGEALMFVRGSGADASEADSSQKEFEQSSIWDGMNDE